MSLFVFEGIDKSGKTTLINIVYNNLIKLNYDVIKLKRPSDDWDEIGTLITSMCKDKRWELSDLSKLFLFLIDKIESTNKIIIPALKQNKIVLCDRWSHSTIAYQFFACNLKKYFEFYFGIETTQKIMNMILSSEGLTKEKIMPKITFFIKGHFNREIDNNDNFENNGDAFTNKAIDGYKWCKKHCKYYDIDNINSYKAGQKITDIIKSVI